MIRNISLFENGKHVGVIGIDDNIKENTLKDITLNNKNRIAIYLSDFGYAVVLPEEITKEKFQYYMSLCENSMLDHDCIYCKDKQTLKIRDDVELEIDSKNSMLFLYGAEVYNQYLRISIQYCPMCGRKLK